MRNLLVAVSLLVTPLTAYAQVSVDIGVTAEAYPQLVPVPGYPVYYDPSASTNYFFYDGLYWVYSGDTWYASGWYNGPWRLVHPEYVPVYVLRIPVRYYRQPPGYFRGWRPEEPPHWGEHWGHDWEGHHRGWDRWDHRTVPSRAPLPTYQRHYSGDRYPRGEQQQRSIRSSNYRYEPREAVTREHFRQHASPGDSRGDRDRHEAVRQPSSPPPQRMRPEHEQPAQRTHEPPRPAQRPEAGPRDTRHEGRGVAQERGHENQPAPREQGHERKNDDRGPKHR